MIGSWLSLFTSEDGSSSKRETLVAGHGIIMEVILSIGWRFTVFIQPYSITQYHMTPKLMKSKFEGLPFNI